VPVWDYLAPQAPNDIQGRVVRGARSWRSGLLDLSVAAHEPRYREAALNILNALSRTCLTNQLDPRRRGRRPAALETGRPRTGSRSPCPTPTTT